MKSHYLNKDDPVRRRICASLGGDELMAAVQYESRHEGVVTVLLSGFVTGW